MNCLKVSMVSVLASCVIGLTVVSAISSDGPLANAVLSFGQWNPNDQGLLPAEVPLDRLVTDPAMGRGNNHELIPNLTTIKAGGSVNFVISGNHVVTIYDDGIKPDDIGDSVEPNCPSTGPITSPCSPVNQAGNPVAGGILSDSDGRIYRGSIGTGRRDGVEVVQFTKPGTYMVICAVKNHFVNDGMFGFVRVLPNASPKQ